MNVWFVAKDPRKLDEGTFWGDSPLSPARSGVGLTNYFYKKLDASQIRTQLSESSILSTFTWYVTPVAEEKQ